MKKLVVLFICVVLFSCTEDSADQSPQEVVMTGYKIDMNTSPGYHFITIGNLVNNKLFSETVELFHNGVVESQLTEQKYFYNADGTLNHFKRDSDGMTTNLYYDSNGNLIGAKLFQNENGSALNFRFIHNSDTEVYYERIDLPYNDPNATPYVRIIININENDEVVSAGNDNNFDGIIENLNTFEYSNGNLIEIHYYIGVNENYQYSTVIDNFSILNQNTFGKKNLAVLTGECFGYLNQYRNINFSQNILQSVYAEATYQVLPNNFYEIKTEINDQTITTTQFFFE